MLGESLVQKTALLHCHSKRRKLYQSGQGALYDAAGRKSADYLVGEKLGRRALRENKPGARAHTCWCIFSSSGTPTYERPRASPRRNLLFNHARYAELDAALSRICRRRDYHSLDQGDDEESAAGIRSSRALQIWRKQAEGSFRRHGGRVVVHGVAPRRSRRLPLCFACTRASHGCCLP